LRQHPIHKKNGTAAIRGRAIPCSGQRFKRKRRHYSAQWGSLVVFDRQVSAQSFADKTAGAIGGTASVNGIPGLGRLPA